LSSNSANERLLLVSISPTYEAMLLAFTKPLTAVRGFISKNILTNYFFELRFLQLRSLHL